MLPVGDFSHFFCKISPIKKLDVMIGYKLHSKTQFWSKIFYKIFNLRHIATLIFRVFNAYSLTKKFNNFVINNFQFFRCNFKNK